MAELTYEKAMEELENIVNKLENSKETMDESFSLYEKGIKLIKFCDEYLNKQENKIRKIEEEK